MPIWSTACWMGWLTICRMAVIRLSIQTEAVITDGPDGLSGWTELVSFALCLKRDALPITQPAKDSLEGLKTKCSMVAPGKRSHLTIFVRRLTAISIGTTINVSRYRWAGWVRLSIDIILALLHNQSKILSAHPSLSFGETLVCTRKIFSSAACYFV